MKLTKGKISKLYNKKKQSIKRNKKQKKSYKRRTFRNKKRTNLARKTLKKFNYKKYKGGDGETDNVPKNDEITLTNSDQPLDITSTTETPVDITSTETPVEITSTETPVEITSTETPVEITALGSGAPAISANAGVAARLILAENGSAKIGGNVSIIGTASGKESLTSLGGTFSFDPSFNAGGDSITLPGKINSYAAKASGSSMQLSAGSSSYLVPVGTTGATLVFDDAFRTLLYADGQFKIGAQIIDGVAASPLIA